MQKFESDWQILKRVFRTYIFHNNMNRALFFPVFFTMIVAKYMEVLGAKQTENISEMIKNADTNLSTLLSYSLVAILSIVLVEIQSFFICKAGRVGYRLASRDALGHFLDLKPQKFGTFGLGAIQNIITRRSQAVQDLIDVFTLNFLPAFLTVIFVSYEVFKGMGLVVVLTVNCSIVAYAIITIKITEWRNKMRKRLNIAQNKSSNIMIDTLSNFETIFSYKSDDYELGKYNSSQKEVEKHSTEISRSLYLLNLSQKGVWCAMTIAIVFISCYSTSQHITVEKFTFLLYIIGLITKTFDNFGFMYGKYKEAMLNAKIHAVTRDDLRNDGYRTAFRLNDAITATNLNISKDGKNIIRDSSFKINKGEKVAIIGKNGAGKSTLIKSLVNLNEYSGEIKIDNIHHKDLTDSSMKSIVAFIPQSGILFDDTVMGNIKYANEKVFDEEIYRTSKDLGIHEAINKLQNGYLTNVGEQGKLLSGGERQKVLILRALLRQSSVLLMDESTASLDKKSELQVMKKIMDMPNLTVLAIVHNLELLKLFDKILLIKDSKIKEIKLEEETNIDSIVAEELNA